MTVPPQGIAATWAGLPLNLADYKGTFKLRSTEDVGGWRGGMRRRGSTVLVGCPK